jgi:UTP--glucose-1-phosphate uridylyltransferase
VNGDGLQVSRAKMHAEGAADVAVDTFAHYYGRLRDGDAGVLPEAEIEPVDDPPHADDLPEPADEGAAALSAAVVIKLNGGLGTSMGMTQAKALLEVKDGLTFLDVIARQVLDLRTRTGAPLPLVLMNSFATREDSLAALARYP